MSEFADCLIEIGTEELPPKALPRLSSAFVDGVRTGLEKSGLRFGNIETYATPRRLAMIIRELQTHQPDIEIEKRGPAVAAAFDAQGTPSKAAEGFARSCQTQVDQLQRLSTDKGEWLVYRAIQPGSKTAGLIPALVQQSLDRLPIPKRMRWGTGSVEFVRPAHWVVMLLGEKVIQGDILGLSAGRQTYGHRFHHPEPITLNSPDDYVALLQRTGHVIPDFATRRQMIKDQVEQIASDLGGQAIIRQALLDEVAALVEFPVALSGSFDTRFLEVPQEALISSMQDHQRYFPVVDETQKLLPHFITVANIQSRNIEAIRSGNERVIRPRLSDAAFFWEQDKQKPLASHQAQLGKVVFQNKLGTLLDKSNRVVSLSGTLAQFCGMGSALVQQAAALCKCDLMTQMVGEFPELQGIMGRYYAQHDGEPERVAMAIEEHYLPRFAGDRLPQSDEGALLAIADKLDTLAGIFSLGLLPTGDKDPYALRRSALGILRILIDRRLDIALEALILAAVEPFAAQADSATLSQQISTFLLERLRAWYLESGVSVGVFEAVRACPISSLTDFDDRIHACIAFTELPAAEALSAANKRVRNILKKAENDSLSSVSESVLTHPAEKALYEQLSTISTEAQKLLEQDYTLALESMAQLREPLDQFFDSVMVMDEDEAIRRNRLALLKQVSDLFMQVADVSHLYS
jgi:glycyl-tRNA synthetase beta chain